MPGQLDTPHVKLGQRQPQLVGQLLRRGAVERHRVGLQQRLPDTGPFIRCGRIAQQDFPQTLRENLAAAARAMLRIGCEPCHRHRYACFFGRPPLAPFARAAAALAGDVTLPPAAPSCSAIQRFVP